MLVDSHCHLDYAPLRDQLPDILANAAAAGVETLLSISTKLAEFKNVLAIAENNKPVYCTIGIHPHNVANEQLWPDDEIYAACQHPKVIGIGEAGLDYYYDYAPKDVQHTAFRKHIEFARHTKLPLIIHTRDADDDTKSILQDEMRQGAFPFLLHCFTGGRDLAMAAIDMGGYVSFSGILTYKTADNLRDIARDLPSDRILVETDSPYLAPNPYRGKSNQPAFVRHTAEILAQTRGVSFDDIAQSTTDNFYRLFSKSQRPT
jgi:TatD DNase family protein